MRLETTTGELIFQSHPGPQTEFTGYEGRYALIGGAAGPGKSECLLYDPWRQIRAEEKRVAAGTLTASVGRCIYFRRTMPEIQEMIDRARITFGALDPGAKFLEQSKTWTFSCGYKYKFAQMEEDRDWIKYLGSQYTYIAFDELTTFTEEQFQMLDTRLRSADPELAKMLWMRAGTNPIGVGLKWVRKRFVEAGPPNKEIVRQLKVPIVVDGAKTFQTVERRQIFIPARVSDNPSMDQAEYSATLMDKPDAVRKAMLEGDWYVVSGAFVGDMWENELHIVKPFKLPPGRHKFRSCYYSFAKSVVLWWAVDMSGNLTCYRELEVKNHTADMLAHRIRELEADAREWTEVSNGFRGRTHSKLTGPLGPLDSCWAKAGQVGPTINESMFSAGVSWHQADNNIPQAVDQIRYRLIRRSPHPTKKDERTGKPLLIVPGIRWFDGCQAAIDTIPSLPTDAIDPDMPDKKSDFAAYMATAYACMSRPIVPKQEKVDEDRLLGIPSRPKRATGDRVGSRSAYPGSWR